MFHFTFSFIFSFYYVLTGYVALGQEAKGFKVNWYSIKILRFGKQDIKVPGLSITYTYKYIVELHCVILQTRVRFVIFIYTD